MIIPGSGDGVVGDDKKAPAPLEISSQKRPVMGGVSLTLSSGSITGTNIVLIAGAGQDTQPSHQVLRNITFGLGSNLTDRDTNSGSHSDNEFTVLIHCLMVAVLSGSCGSPERGDDCDRHSWHGHLYVTDSDNGKTG